jgi:hypothetical protein
VIACPGAARRDPRTIAGGVKGQQAQRGQGNEQPGFSQRLATSYVDQSLLSLRSYDCTKSLPRPTNTMGVIPRGSDDVPEEDGRSGSASISRGHFSLVAQETPRNKDGRVKVSLLADHTSWKLGAIRHRSLGWC